VTTSRLLLGLGLGLVPLALASGGPDDGGYVFAETTDDDGPPHHVMDAELTDLALTDEDTGLVALPFDVDWYDVALDQVLVGDNATAFFYGSQAQGDAVCPADGGDWEGIAALWADHDADSVGWGVVGYYPHRVVVLDWQGLHPDGVAGDGRVQVWLQEATDEVVVVLDDVDFGDASYDGGAGMAVGVQANDVVGLPWSCEGGLTSGSSAWFGPQDARPDAAEIGLSEVSLLFYGSDDSDQAGSLTTAGDVNDDGLADLLVGAPGGDAVALWYGGPGLAGDELDAADVTLTGDAGDEFGAAVAVVDLDGDGQAEIAVGAPENDTADTNAGVVYLLDTSELATSVDLSTDAHAFLTGPAGVGARVGATLHGPGDVDGDGYGDLLVGAPEDDTVATNAGAVYLWSGGTVSGTSDLSASPSFLGELVTDRLGSSLAGADVDGDGLSELVFGAPYHDAGSGDEGRTYVVAGAAWSGANDVAAVATADFTGDSGSDQLGAGLLLFDLDGDGLTDLLTGVPAEDGAAPNGGAVLLFSDLSTWTGSFMGGDADAAIYGDSSGDGFGSSLAASDLDADGQDDLVVAGAAADHGAPSGGAVWAWRTLPSSGGVASDADHRLDGQLSGASAGTSLASAGDMNGDGYGDVAVGSPFASVFGPTLNGLVSVWSYYPSFLDEDGDGVVAWASSGPDCGDDDPLIYPGAGEDTATDTALTIDDDDCDGWIDGAYRSRTRADWWGWDLAEFLGDPATTRFDFDSGTAGTSVATLHSAEGLTLSASGSVTADTSVGGATADGLAARVGSGTTNSVTLSFSEPVDALSFQLLDAEAPFYLAAWNRDGDPLAGGYVTFEHDGNNVPGGRFVGFLFDEGVETLWIASTAGATWGFDDLDVAWTADSDRDGDGYSLGDGDCDDDDAAASPGGEELLDDGVDNDCDGTTDAGTSEVEEDDAVWTGDVSVDVTRLDFEELDDGEVVDDDYDSLGVNVDGLVVTTDVDGAAPVDAQGALATTSVTLTFDELQPGVGFQLLDGFGVFTALGYVDGSLIYENTITVAEEDVDGGSFHGLLYGYGVDELVIAGPVADTWGLDDVVFATLGLDDADGDGLTEADGDCDDDDATTYPGAEDTWYDGVDSDCAGDDDYDADGDGYSSDGFEGLDCNDSDASTNPSAAEVWYDGTDSDCAGDDDYDSDGDGHRSEEYGGDDCEDADSSVSPSAEEVFYDGIDDNCYAFDDDDADGDGWGATGGAPGELGGGDCDDGATATYPGASDSWYDGVDSDCGGESDYDADGDGYDNQLYGGDDCNDAAAQQNPGADDTCYDGVDQDCAGDDDYDCDGDGHALEPRGGDCDDDDPSVNPDATESDDEDGVDEDCDGTDEWDDDGDGFRGVEDGGEDCDDEDAAIHPDAVEICYDGVDDNCSGHSDDDCDEDGEDRIAAGGSDCNDLDPDIGPTAREVCYDGIDQDCAGDSDEFDCDGDGFDSDTYGGADCDDDDADVNPDATEEPYNTVDEDCSGDASYDADEDGFDGAFYGGDDCDDDDPSVHPDAAEVCYDGVDDNCSGHDDADCDEDGYDAALLGGDDCDDGDDAVHPGATEVWYDGVDGDCAGDSDDDADADGWDVADDCDDAEPTTYPGASDFWYDGVDADCDFASDYDADGDGFDVDFYGGLDCDDTDPDVSPAAVEVWYDGVDGDCSGDADADADADGFPVADDCDDNDAEVHPSAAEIWYDGVDTDCAGDSDFDADADGADASSAGGTDCDDADAAVGPHAEEVWYDGFDQDCDGGSDLDADGDGVDAASEGGADCDDARADVYPGAADSWYDGVDSDCAGDDDFDADLDGYQAEAWGGEDCDDLSADVSPAVSGDDCGNGDEDCDGLVDEDCVVPVDTDGTAIDTGDPVKPDDTDPPVEDLPEDPVGPEAELYEPPPLESRCGCSGGAGASGLWVLALAVGLRRRRR